MQRASSHSTAPWEFLKGLFLCKKIKNLRSIKILRYLWFGWTLWVHLINFLKIVVLTWVRTASTYLSSSTSLSGLVRWNRFSNNYITQWLIGIFVRSYSSKDYLINCAGVRQRTILKNCSVSLPEKKPPVLVALIGRLLWKSFRSFIIQS